MVALSVIVGVLAALLVVVLIAFVWYRQRQSNGVTVASGQQAVQIASEHSAALAERDVRIAHLEERLSELKSAAEQRELVVVQLTSEKQTLLERVARLETQLENSKTETEAKLKLLMDARSSMTAEFKNLSQDILDKNSKKLTGDSQQLLKPLQDDLQRFQKRVNDIHTADTEQYTLLNKRIEDLQKGAFQISQDADNLTRALKGDSKLQGDWGEVQLETLLDRAGLTRGESYEVQRSYRDTEQKLQRPDVIIHTPNNRDFVVDSKVSIRAFVEASNASDSSQETLHLAQHVKDVKEHVKKLAAHDYQSLPEVNTLDMVFMFMSVEPALTAALTADRMLFNYAFERKVILCSPTTLLPILRTVEQMWRYEHQNRNAQEIARRGGLLYDKFSNLIKDFEEVGKALQRAQERHTEAHKKLHTGRGNLVEQVNKLQELGASTKKGELRSPQD